MDSIVVLPSKLEREVEGVVNPIDVQQHLIVFSDSPQLLEFLQIAVLDGDGFLVVFQLESPEVEAGNRFVQRLTVVPLRLAQELVGDRIWQLKTTGRASS